ncbi:MAG: guanylate kinase [Spirochaetia bacterium]|nr:guanylate kinase [Spirochaetia bacterium]
MKIFVISAPSGTGKNTIINRLLERRNDLIHSISTTTRAIRKGEKEAVNYYYLSKDKFNNMISKNEFLEWAKVLDNYYGTSKKEIERIFSKNKNAILDLDVQGAFQVKKTNPESVIIFIKPPSLKELERRLKERGSESEDEIKKRLILAEVEIKTAKKFDHILINDKLKETTEELDGIISDHVLD